MTALDPQIILAGRPANVLGAMADGMQLRAASNEMATQNALSALYRQHGAGLLRGDPAAMNALAAIDAPAAIDMGTALLGQQATREGMANDATRLDLLRRELEARFSAEEREQLALEGERRMSAALMAYEQGPEAFAAYAARTPGLEGVSFDAFPMEYARAGGELEVIRGILSPEPSYREVGGTLYDMAAPGGPSVVLPGPAPETSRIVTGKDAAALGLDPAGSYNVTEGPNGQTATRIGGGSTSTTINVGPNGLDLGDPPAGYGWRRDPLTGEIVLDGRGLPIAEPYQGGPAWREQQEAEAEAQQAATVADAAEQRQEGTANLMLEDIGRVKALVTANPRLTTGLLGNILKTWAGTPAADVAALTETIGANISFEYLSQMRAASPTGAALGSITERELAMLAATAGSLAQSQSAEQLLYNLNRLEHQLDEVINGPAAQRGAPPAATGAAGAAGAAGAPDYSTMTEDDLLRSLGIAP